MVDVYRIYRETILLGYFFRKKYYRLTFINVWFFTAVAKSDYGAYNGILYSENCRHYIT